MKMEWGHLLCSWFVGLWSRKEVSRVGKSTKNEEHKEQERARLELRRPHVKGAITTLASRDLSVIPNLHLGAQVLVQGELCRVEGLEGALPTKVTSLYCMDDLYKEQKFTVSFVLKRVRES